MNAKQNNKATLYYLFNANKTYTLEIPINKEHYLFIEGLNENGCTNTYLDEFNINNIKNFCIELFDSVDVVDDIDSIGVTLNTTIEELKARVNNLEE